MQKKEMSATRVTRACRLPLSLDKELQDIAKLEERTIGQVMYRLLAQAVKRYKAVPAGQIQWETDYEQKT